jgi:quercetin dioxygenase-like cupin family protein
MYVVRNHFRSGQGSRPQYHDQDRYITVLKGASWVDTGDVYEPDKMVAIKADGFMFHPAGFRHYDGAKDEDVVVQITGVGRVKTVQTEVK